LNTDRALFFPFLVLLVCAAGVARAETPVPTPFSAAIGDQPPAPWRVVGAPRVPLTRFSLVGIDGLSALRIEADASYGNLVHPLDVAGARPSLVWKWRVDRLVDKADLHTKDGDDVALKVCVLFDLPLHEVPFVERQLLRLARLSSGEPLPSATVCYAWDRLLPPGTAVDNAYSRRLRYLVLQSGTQRVGRWIDERRDVAADFFRLFGGEAAALPPIIGIAVGADADNTQGRSLGFVAELALRP
jgi:Protein of unknown function (DUF3047)